MGGGINIVFVVLIGYILYTLNAITEADTAIVLTKSVREDS